MQKRVRETDSISVLIRTALTLFPSDGFRAVPACPVQPLLSLILPLFSLSAQLEMTNISQCFAGS